MAEQPSPEQNKENSKDSGHKDIPKTDGLKNVLPAGLQHLLEGIPEDKKEEIEGAFFGILMARSYRGPLPPPEMLAKYNEALPNGAERVIAMAEKQSSHRMELEKNTITEELRQSRRGQAFGFILGLIGLFIAGILAYWGHDWFAGVLGTTTIIGLVSIFVIGKKMQVDDLEEKSRD